MLETIDEYRTRVVLSDTTARGELRASAPVAWLQRGIENLYRRAGYPVEVMLAGELAYPVVALGIRYLSPVELGESLIIQTQLIMVGNRSYTERCQVSLADGTLAVEVQWTHVVVRAGKPVGVPEWLRELAGPEGAAVRLSTGPGD